ncbi:restriction endonuclease subunit S [Faecalibacillus intestinalis]|uniref:restriction endonuclease subunit S n=1 Tax=Faecalibacillus intestinalis TaxID=1982626 RepID=UPI003AB36B6A
MKLGNICSITGGYAFDSRKMKSKGEYQIIKMGNLYNGVLDLTRNPSFIDNPTKKELEYLIHKNDILITLTGTVNKKDYGYTVQLNNPNNLLLNQRCALIKPLKINEKYLFYLLNSNNFFKQFYASSTGGTGNQTNVSINDMLNFNMYIANEKNQIIISEFLNKIDQRIETQIKIISSIESQIKSINNHVAFDSATNELSIGNLFDIKTNSKILEKHDGKYCIVDMGTIDSNGNYITGKYTDDITSILTKGTLVMPKDDIGGGKIICKTLYINESNKYVLSDHVFALKLRNSKYNPLYFSSLINSQYHNHNLKRLVTGSAQLGINQENLNKYKLRFSDCLELQKKYSKLIQLINEKLFIEKKLLYDLYNQKNYLMKNMFI